MPTTTAVPAISVTELAAGAADAELFADGPVPTDPLLLVGLDTADAASPTELARAAHRAVDSDRLLVGLLPPAADPVRTPEWDALLTALAVTLGTGTDRNTPRTVVPVPDTAIAALRLYENVIAQPVAALTLNSLLRLTEHLPVAQALDAESLAYSTLLGGAGFARWADARGKRPAPPHTPTAEPVLLRREGDTLRLTLNRPQRRNAHSAELRDALVAALRVAQWDDSLAHVVLDGNGPSFCSGGDLDEFGTTGDLAAAHLLRTRAGAARPLHALRERITARLHGHCIGAGIELPAFASRVIADPATVFRLPELGMGLIPGAGGTVSIPRRIGRWRTAHMVLTGDTIDAARALSWGLVDGVDSVVTHR
ncbi:enoyl-CoA hydratase/isomerase family protein [Streptomyces sp. NPDC056656]|uniref:enoyl-CoA hydratase/isomerase family protein n=1 Tax=Streptomyces sp. NPDC056656 TaxID=3345895 RepID=UPI003686AA3B